ncbi:unnamed protein product, partial [Mesorhabditis spiculigera]
MEERIDIGKPRWDQATFEGRLRHFASITDPLAVFYPKKELLAARKLVFDYKAGSEPVGTKLEDVYRAQKVFGTAFHPDTGELQNLPGRMCFNVYGGTMLCGAMMIWYKSTPAVLFWQWANQSFNALVNYTNRNAKSSLSTTDLVTAYAGAVTGALAMATGLKAYFAKRQVSTILQRWVPFSAVAVANAINIPMMRQNELKNGVVCEDEHGNAVGTSRLAAVKGISQVILSRIVIVAPTMVVIPLIVEGLNKIASFRRNLKYLNIPTQLALTFIIYGAMVPVGCAVYPQRSSIKLETLKKLEPEAYDKMKTSGLTTVYFNKGL